MKITHLTIGLGNGGAEAMLYNLLKFQVNPNFEYQVVSLGCGDYYSEAIRKLNVPLIHLDLKNNPIKTVFFLKKIINQTDMLVCWMYHACLIGSVYSKLLKKRPILIWNICHNNLDKNYNKKSTIWIAEQCRKRSGQVDKVIYNGEPSQRTHINFGFDKNNSVVLGNGCDTEFFRYKENSKEEINKMFPIKGKKIILSVARYHIIKDFPLIFSTMEKLKKAKKEVILIMCGPGVTIENKELKNLLKKHQLQYGKDVFLIGPQKNLPFWFSAADLYVLHSASEAFSNTLIQAMSCAIPCISTDVGVAKELLEKEYIVPISNSEEMANCINQLLIKDMEDRKRIGIANRKKIKDSYDIRQIVKKYEEEFNMGIQ